MGRDKVTFAHLALLKMHISPQANAIKIKLKFSTLQNVLSDGYLWFFAKQRTREGEEKCHNMVHMQKNERKEISFNKSYFYDSMM